MNTTRIRTDETGQTATEFALVLPIICVLLFAVIQFGIAFNNYVTLTDAVRAGARKAAVSRYESDPVGVTKTTVNKAAANLDLAKLVVLVTPSPSWKHGQDVTVEARYPYQINLLGWIVYSGDLTSKTTERVE